MLNEPVWLDVEQAIAVNQDEVAETGEPHSVLDMGKLESAFGRPQNHFHYTGDNDILRLAMILVEGIAQAHAFEQGNKRTAWT